MRARLSIGLAVGAMLTLCLGSPAGATPATVSVGYFDGSDIYSGYYPKNIPVGNYTHINYAFADPAASGKCRLVDPAGDYRTRYTASHSVGGVADGANQKLRGNFNQLKRLKAAHPGLKVLISIGGWTLSNYFSNIAASAASRQIFVASCISLFIKGNLPVSGSQGGSGAAKGVFDGIDIDWEFPVTGGEDGNVHRNADKHNATLLFKEFRKQLNTYGQSTGKTYLLTAAIPSGDQAGGSYELSTVATTLDWLNLMAYDMHGGWDDTTDFDSPFKFDAADPAGRAPLNVKGTVNFMLGKGVPASKLVIGVPYYAYQYTGVNNADSGLYQSFSDAVTNPTYRQVLVLDNTPGYTEHWSNAAGEPWLWNPSAAGGTFVTYEDAASIDARVSYVKNKGLRGLMSWEVSQEDDGHTLSTALGHVLH